MDPTNNSQQIPQIVPPPTPVIEVSPPPADAVSKPKKKWGTGVLIGSAAALMVLTVGLVIGDTASAKTKKSKNKGFGHKLCNQYLWTTNKYWSGVIGTGCVGSCSSTQW